MSKSIVAILLFCAGSAGAITVDPNQQIGTDFGKETAAAWTASAQPGFPKGITAVAYTDQSCKCLQWARTDASGAVPTWEAHSSNSWLTGAASTLHGSDGKQVQVFGPDPLILGVPQAGATAVKDRFVIFSILSTVSNHDQDVYIAVSDDGAHTFDRFALVTKSAGGGSVDRPSAAVDPVNGKIWVWWAQNTTSGERYWVNSISIGAAKTDAPVIGTPDRFSVPIGISSIGHGSMAVRHVNAVGGGGTEVMFAWPDGYAAGDDCPAKNTDASGYNKQALHWYLSSKTYALLTIEKPAQLVQVEGPTTLFNLNGWAHHPISTAAVDTFKGCVAPGAPSSFYGTGSIPQIVYDTATGKRFVAIGRSFTHSDRVGMVLYTSTDETTWTQTKLATTFGDTADAWRPSVAMLPGQLALTYYTTDDTNTTTGGNVTRYGAIMDLASGTWSRARLSNAGPGQMVPSVGAGNNGDYEGLAAELQTGTFLDSYSDNRLGNSTTPAVKVWGSRFRK
jgi:hypothetical protein